MHGVGGPRNKFNSLKCYVNHTTAFEGQFRMPRNYPQPKVNIKVNNTQVHNCCTNNVTEPFWLRLFNTLMPFLPTPQEEVNPLQEQLDELETPEPETPKPTPDPEPDPEPEPKIEETFDVSAEAEEVPETTTEEITTTTEAVVKKGRKRADGLIEYQGWRTLAASYPGVPNTKEFRNWFRKEHLNGKDIWELGTQNFPTEIEYPEGSGKIYKFNVETFSKPIDLHDNSGSGSVTTANMDKKTKTKESTKTTYRGSAKATWTDEKGKEHTATYTTPQGTTYQGTKEAKNAALAGVKAKVPAKHQSNAKFQVGTRET